MDEIPNLVSLRVKCPVCGHSLMDEKRPIDNCPSIRMKVDIGEESGIINLSSVWESYNFLCTIETPKGEILNLSCPHCNSAIKGKTDCEVCEAPMIPLDLELGGDVCICSRKGCRSHFVKFVDFSFALKQLHIDTEKKLPATDEEEQIEIMHTGTFLQTYCPHCKKSMIQEGSIKLKIDRDDKEGYLMLSPYLNVFTSRSTIRLPEDQIISNIRCFHCDESLEIQDEVCGACGSRIVRLVVGATSRLVNFYICSRKGCTWHGLSREDMDDIRLEQSLEW